MYKFNEPLIEGTIIKRNSQFTAEVSLDGEVITVHVPNTGRIGDDNLLFYYLNNKKNKLIF